MSGPIGDPQGTQARAIDAERRHPTSTEQPPGPFRRNQLIVLAVVIGLPLLAYGIKYWLQDSTERAGGGSISSWVGMTVLVVLFGCLVWLYVFGG